MLLASDGELRTTGELIRDATKDHGVDDACAGTEAIGESPRVKERSIYSFPRTLKENGRP